MSSARQSDAKGIEPASAHPHQVLACRLPKHSAVHVEIAGAVQGAVQGAAWTPGSPGAAEPQGVQLACRLGCTLLPVCLSSNCMPGVAKCARCSRRLCTCLQGQTAEEKIKEVAQGDPGNFSAGSAGKAEAAIRDDGPGLAGATESKSVSLAGPACCAAVSGKHHCRRGLTPLCAPVQGAKAKELAASK